MQTLFSFRSWTSNLLTISSQLSSSNIGRSNAIKVVMFDFVGKKCQLVGKAHIQRINEVQELSKCVSNADDEGWRNEWFPFQKTELALVRVLSHCLSSIVQLTLTNEFTRYHYQMISATFGPEVVAANTSCCRDNSTITTDCKLLTSWLIQIKNSYFFYSWVFPGTTDGFRGVRVLEAVP